MKKEWWLPLFLLAAACSDESQPSPRPGRQPGRWLHRQKEALRRDPVETTLAGLEHRDPAVRAWAAEALGLLGETPEAARIAVSLLAAAAGEEQQVRTNAMVSLFRLGEPVLPTLARALGHDDLRVREAAAIILARQETKSLPALVRALAHEGAQVRIEALAILADLGTRATPALKGILPLAEDSDREVRTRVMIALGRISPQAPAAREALIRGKQDRDGQVRRAAARALGD